MMTTAESTDRIQRKRLAVAWAKAYGEGRAATQHQDIGDESRPVADAQAAWRRWHVPNLDSRWSASEWPWFEALERARVEQVASKHLPGIAHNLANPDRTAPPPGLRGDIYRSARRVFSGVDILDEPIFGSIRARSTFQRWISRLISRRSRPSDSKIVAGLINARRWLDDPVNFCENIKPLIDILSESQEPCSGGSPNQVSTTPEDFLSSEDLEPAAPEVDHTCLEKPVDEDIEIDALGVNPDYSIYSNALDEEAPAKQWLRPQDKELLSSLNRSDRLKIRQLAHKLQRRLQAAKLRHWRFDQDEGLLDSRRLCRLIADNSDHRIFRREQESLIPSACVCFLVDLSGSMRGERLRLAAITVDLAVHTLERCGIECEVLGYTTSFGADNPLAVHWKQAGRREAPGRLNAVRHVVFKSTKQRWRRARQSLGLMLREDFGHENIDGEALHWAARRLAVEPTPNRILLVLSDGQPYDEATANGNGRDFLEGHLRSTIKQIEQSKISLIAIGAGMSVSRFYNHAVTVDNPAHLGERLFNLLDKALVVPHEAVANL